MTNRMRTAIVLLVLTFGLTGCDGTRNPSAPSPAQTKVIELRGNSTDRAGNALPTFENMWTGT